MIRRAIVVFAGAVLAGGVLGWSTAARPEGGEVAAKAVSGPRDPQRPRWGKEDFLKGIRDRVAMPNFNPLARELAEWTDEELKATLKASLVHPDCLLPGDGASIPRLLLAEWLRRDFGAALAWVDGLEPGKSAELMIKALAIHWPEERGEEGFNYLLANRERLSRSGVFLVMNALQGRVNEGAAATVDFVRRLREEGLEFPDAISGGRFPAGIMYPPGFDFPALVASEEFAHLEVPDEFRGVSSAEMILREWHLQDREAAAAWAMEKFGMEGLGKIAMNHKMDPAANLAWVAGKVEAMDGAGRSEFIGTVLEEWAKSPDRLRHFSAGLSDPVLLDEVHRVGVQSLFGGIKYGAIPFLEDMNPARRIELMENAEPGGEFSGNNQHWRHFTATDESLLRNKLAEWRASDEQIDRIISRFKP